MNQPLVSVICLCHNQATYVLEALESVLKQSYPSVELIIVDDGSADGTKEAIKGFLESNEQVEFVDIPSAIGNCAAFNQGWRKASGEFIIDLAADDILLPTRVEIGIKRLNESGAGVHFSDADLVNEQGKFMSRHNERFQSEIPEGDIYAVLVEKYLVCPSTMMIRQEVLEKLNGYDESMAFEDFDFWVRSARHFDYCYSDEVLVKKRIVKESHSARQGEFRNKHQQTILKVCQKVLEMNRTVEEGSALKKRCWHEIRQCIKKGNLGLIPDYLSIIKKCQ